MCFLFVLLNYSAEFSHRLDPKLTVPATVRYLDASVLFDALYLPWKSSKKDDIHGC